MNEPDAKRRGPKAVYRGKIRQPVSVLLTPDGHVALARELRRTGLSRGDLFETLLRKYGRRVPSTLAAS